MIYLLRWGIETKSKNKNLYNSSSVKITTNEVGRGSEYIFT